MNIDCKYYDEYYDYILRDKFLDSKAKKAVFDIIKDIEDRRGLKNVFEDIDGDIQDEIIDTWISIVANIYDNQGA